MLDESKSIDQSSSMSPLQSESSSLSKGSSILSLMKKYARTVSTEYHLTHSNNAKHINEPTLLEVKYLDGRSPLKDDIARESFRKTQTLSGSISSRFNRIGLSSKLSSTQDLSSVTSKALNGSCRKRILDRFRTLLDTTSAEHQSPPYQSRPWQHKTITELFHERKYKVHRH
jgi:hypothetical protein